jgi:hypothetical protein
MGAPKVGNVSTGKPSVSGGIWIADAGTSAPTDATTTLTGFTALGYVSEDGLTNSNSPESDSGKAWGGDIVITYQTEKPDTFQFTLIGAKDIDVLEAVYGSSNVTGTLSTGITVTANATEAEEHVWVFEVVMRDNTYKRIVVPAGKVTEVGDITYTDDEIVGYELTVQAFPDTSNNTHYEYIVESAS